MAVDMYQCVVCVYPYICCAQSVWCGTCAGCASLSDGMVGQASVRELEARVK